jgi:glucose-1-phosphate cytidylyltransferase
MKAVILCGGFGTRLREETEFKPKPMVSIGGMPILWHIMKTYSHYGVNDFVLCLGYKSEMIKQFFLDQCLSGKDFTVNLKTGKRTSETGNEDWTVTLADTGLNTLTGGRIKRIQKYVSDDDFLMTYGDGLADVNIDSLLQLHKKEDKIGTLTGVTVPSRWGVVKTSDNLVTEFIEKPKLDDYISGGFFAFKKDVFDYLEEDENCVLETGLSALAKKRQLAIYRHNGFWYAMDTYRDVIELNKMWDNDKAPWKIW